jgi:hypothetical protein
MSRAGFGTRSVESAGNTLWTVMTSSPTGSSMIPAGVCTLAAPRSNESGPVSQAAIR